ncbi:sec14 cytosolic factor family protein [Schizosaccharomyces cryophilus OY26]|uniref:Sec14 cytosolic factor family protein n=1 Tax=Schizosaccharomyces cryophilus (strain OY26 / ATCC MYA-4695 / CBS 11777 / NBRC 106824 / NRRL Y48691) TaxID=653667 RepID=S9W6B9_SCHCR|nr:sec14 cytosolic factor family protein [Schizosaccharomyces cryophilus OY26]EPY53360.1 sec14 cytosolic factor family protein [Schizosaccharomyces cryophilus OY26]
MFSSRLWSKGSCSTVVSALAAGTFFFRRSQPSTEQEDILGSFQYATCSPLKSMIQKTWPSIQENKTYRNSFIHLAKCDSPDAILIRFLKSCRMDPDQASVKLLNTLRWRIESNVDQIVERGELFAKEHHDDQFLEQLRTGKVIMLGRDLKDRPICYIRAHLHQPSKLTQKSLCEMTIWAMETMRLFLHSQPTLPASLEDPQNVNVLFDMSKFSLSNMDYSFVKYLSSCLECYYPESLGVCILHKSPWIFRGIWNIIKGWIKPEITEKIIFTQNSKDLEKYIGRHMIPATLGGDNQNSFEYVEPKENENQSVVQGSLEKETALAHYYAYYNEWEQRSLQWAKTPNEDLQNEKLRLSCDIAGAQFAKDYWNVDKYLRARTVYDRLGWLN